MSTKTFVDAVTYQPHWSLDVASTVFVGFSAYNLESVLRAQG
jgi:hypothetical protein